MVCVLQLLQGFHVYLVFITKLGRHNVLSFTWPPKLLPNVVAKGIILNSQRDNIKKGLDTSLALVNALF